MSVLRRLLFDAGGWASILDPALDDEVHKVVGSGGAIEKWHDALAVHGQALKGLVSDWPELAEVFARRNLFMHRRGRVDGLYVKRVQQAPVPAIGSLIELDAHVCAMPSTAAKSSQSPCSPG